MGGLYEAVDDNERAIGYYERAIGYYERILLISPENGRAQARLTALRG